MSQVTKALQFRIDGMDCMEEVTILRSGLAALVGGEDRLSFDVLNRKMVVRPIIHWNYDPATPRGPSMSIRPRPEQCRDWDALVGFEFVRNESLDCCTWHWGMQLRKPVVS